MSIELSGQNRKQIYIVSELFYPETISTGYILTEIAISLSKNNRIKVIAGPEFYEKKNLNGHNTLENIEIVRGDYLEYNKNNFISRIYGNILLSWKMLKLMKLNIPKGAQILMVTNPLLLFVLSSFYVKKKSWKIKLIVHDVFPENLIVADIISSKKSLYYKFLARLFRKAYLKMETLIVLGRDMKKLFEDKTKGKSKIRIIENWADTANINRHELKNSDLNFMFAGNLGRLQGIDILLKAIEQTKNYNYSFTFIGTGVFENKISDFINSSNLKNIEKYGWLPRENQDLFLAKASIGVISLKGGMFGLGVPSKCYNLLAAGKPIFYIGDSGSEIHCLIMENNIGWFAEAGNIDNIKNTIIEIIDTEKSILEIKGVNARKLAQNHFSKEMILEKYDELFEN